MKKLFFLSFCLITINMGFGQDSIPAQEPLIIDKFTNHIFFANYTATVVPEHALQLDVDFVYISVNYGKDNDFRHKEGSLPELKFRYGLFKNIELRAGTRIGYGYERLSFYGPNDPNDLILNNTFHYQEIFPDYLTLGIKASLLKYNQGNGLISILAESYVPVLRAEDVRSGHPLPAITLLNSDQLNEWLGYNINAGAILNFTNRGDFVNAINICLTPVVTISNPIKAFAGINVLMDPEPPTYNYYFYHTGLIYTPASKIQIKGAFSLGRYPASSVNTYHSNLGISWQIL